MEHELAPSWRISSERTEQTKYVVVQSFIYVVNVEKTILTAM
jgi:hypothetical protein